MLIILVPAAGAQPAGEASPVHQLVDTLSGIDTLRADVRQLVLDQAGREVEEERGRLVMQKPDKFYWAITEPYDYQLMTDGTTIWQYEPDLEQVTIQDFSEDLDRTPVLLLNSDAETLARSFDIRMDRIDADHVLFTLLPLTPSSLFERLSVTFDNGVIDEMYWDTSLGQKTSLSFSNVETNMPVDADIFTFEAPAGIEVMDTRE